MSSAKKNSKRENTPLKSDKKDSSKKSSSFKKDKNRRKRQDDDGGSSDAEIEDYYGNEELHDEYNAGNHRPLLNGVDEDDDGFDDDDELENIEDDGFDQEEEGLGDEDEGEYPPIGKGVIYGPDPDAEDEIRPDESQRVNRSSKFLSKAKNYGI